MTIEAKIWAAHKRMHRENAMDQYEWLYECRPVSDYQTVGPQPSPWERTPWWIFWQPPFFRRNWRLNRAGDMWLAYIEYQCEAYVAREFLEKTCQ